MSEAVALAERPPVTMGGAVGIAVFDPQRGCVHVGDAFAALLAAPQAGETFSQWLSARGAGFAPQEETRQLALRGVGDRRVELVLARLPDGQVVATARPGRPDPESGYDGVLDAATEWFWEMDAALRFSHVSERFGVIAGVPPEAVLGRSRPEFIGPSATEEDAERLRQHLADIEARRPFRNFVYSSSADGRRRFFRISGEPRFAPDGAFLGYVGVGTVVTEHVAVRQMLEEVPIPLLICRHADGCVLHLNAAAAARLAIGPAAAGGTAAADYFHDRAAYAAVAALAEAGGDAMPEVRMRAADGAGFWAQVSARDMIFGGRRALLIGLQDVTERRAAQEKLAAQLHFQEALLDSIPSPVFYKDRAGVYLGCNEAFCSYMGLERRQVIGRTAYDVAPKDLADRYTAADSALYDSLRIQVYEGAVAGATGDRRQVVFYKAPFFRLDGSLGGLIGTMLDITDQKLLEEALRSRSNDLRAILDAGPVGVLITAHDDDQILFANARCAEILEMSKLSLIGGSARDCFEPTGRGELLAGLARDGRVRDAEIRMRRASGPFWALVSVEQIPFDNRLAALFWIYDISDRRKLDEERRKLFRAVHHSPASVVITDRDGFIEYVNPRFCQITGYAVEEVLGNTPSVCKSGETPPEVYADLWRTIRSGRTWQGELRNRRKDGGLYWENVLIAPIPKADGEITHFVAVKSDVTAHKEAELALVEAKERAEDAARAKSEFLAMMSHEIRTPMNGILGMINLLRETALDEVQRDFAETARASSEALLAILNDILDFSKLEARQLALESVPLDLHALVEGVVGLMRRHAEEKGLPFGLALDASTPRRVRGDPARLRQVLLNLLSNAIKFTERGEVGLRVAAGRRGVRFAVSDTGIGVAPEVKAKLFSEFVQADSTIARRFGGTGLGLAICRKIVTLMDGEIGLDSEPGRGSVFWFEVPLPLGEAAETALQGEEHRRGGSIMGALNILLAEDNPVNQKVATALLAKQGHAVSVAKDGFEAVAAVVEGAYDLVLMDVQMPGLDGFEATRRIRALPDGKSGLPIIAMTANALKGDEQRCLDAGMDDYVSKPIHPQALHAAIERQSRRLSVVPGAASVDAARLRALEEQVGTETMLALLADCADALPGYMAQAEAAAAAGNAAALRNAAHDVKSLAATFGLGELAELALDVEGAARDGRTAAAAAPLPELRRRLEAGVAALRRLYPAG